MASSRAGELYGLQVLDEGIQDNKDNVTRFLVLSRDPCTSVPGDARPFKTSIVFAMPERAGQLFKVRWCWYLQTYSHRRIQILHMIWDHCRHEEPKSRAGGA